jgi:hypothetical protein
MSWLASVMLRSSGRPTLVANAAVAYARLVELGKENLAFATPLATYGTAQYKAGRRVGCRLNVRDVSSEYAQRRKRFIVERLDKYDDDEGTWQQAVVQDTRSSKSPHSKIPSIVARRQ